MVITSSAAWPYIHTNSKNSESKNAYSSLKLYRMTISIFLLNGFGQQNRVKSRKKCLDSAGLAACSRRSGVSPTECIKKDLTGRISAGSGRQESSRGEKHQIYQIVCKEETN